MRRCVAILIISMFILTACATGEAQRQELVYKSAKSLQLEIKGTYGYTTLEAPTGTIDQYIPSHDSTKLPDCQVGFRLQVPLSIRNVGDNEWYDPTATLTLTIINPKGEPEKLTFSFKEAKIMRRLYVAGEKIDVLEPTTTEDRTLKPGEKRVFYFATDYMPSMTGSHIVNINLESINKIRGVLIARSALTFNAGNPDSDYFAMPSTCSPYIQCAGIQICCSKGVNIPTEDTIGHCAKQCVAGEKEVPYIIEFN